MIGLRACAWAALTSAALAAGALGCNRAVDDAALTQTSLHVEGMTCNDCVQAITATLMQIDGVRAAKVYLKKRRANIRYDASRVTVDALIAAIDKLGYKARRVAAPTPPRR